MNRYLARLFAVAIVVMLVLSIVPAQVSAITEGKQANAKYKWVFMVYLDADNNLEGAGISDFNEMEMAGSTDDVAIVVMMDRTPGYDTSNGDWTDTRVYLVQFDTDPENISSQLLVDLGERNMGDPNTVLEFVTYVHEHLPSEHYALVFWDHGNAWRRAGPGSPNYKGVCWDDTNGSDYLTEQEIVQVLTEIRDMGIHLDIVGFDVCLLGQAEILYDIGLIGVADVFVASQEYEPWDGWYYTPFLQALTMNPDMSAEELASKIVDAYGEFYTNIVKIDYATLAAFNISTFMTQVVPQIDALGRVLTYSVYYAPDTAGVVHDVWSVTDRMGEGEFPDLYNFSQNILADNRWNPNYDPRPVAQDLINALENATINYWHGPDHPGSHGISIYIPASTDAYLEERYWYLEQTALPNDTWWGWFLDYYFWRLEPPTKSLKIIPAAPAFINKGSKGYAFIEVLFGGTKIDPDGLRVSILYPDGTSVSLSATRLSPGVYVVEVPPVDEDTTIMMLVDASYWFLDATASAAVKVSEISSQISSLEDQLGSVSQTVNKVSDVTYEIAGAVIAIRTAVGTVLTTLDSLNAKIAKIQGDVVYINTSIGTLKTSLDSLNTKITTVGDNVVEIKTSLGTIKGTIESIDGNVVTIKTDLGTIKTTVDKIDDKAGSIQSTLGSVKDTVSSISDKVGSVESKVSSLQGAAVWYYIIAVLVIIAIVLQIVTLARKK
ncbi:MAG: hypothetical protein J7J27_02440 [Euryarchaeota archaeon]|nr:hypothetical protein [Euryarchaeota archaeon]